MAKNILITGPPGCGKSTLIERILSRIDRPCTGFFTREIREGGKRVGFAILTLKGEEGILARVGHPSPVRVGKYGVHLEDLERLAVPAMIPSRPDEIVVVDEIGKMESRSSVFRRTLEEILDSPHRLLGSIAWKGEKWIEEIKRRSDVRLIGLSEKNRDACRDEILRILQQG
jgi:nucleoside-triphosphatase THEP1